MLSQVIESLKGYNKSIDEKKVRFALDLIRDSKSVLKDEHAASVSMLESLIPLRPDEDTVLAALLHRLFADGLLNKDLIKEVLGEGVLNILYGVEKLESLSYSKNDRAIQVENLRNMILVMARDIRVILVALACRLYKMSNLEEILDEDELKAYSTETLHLYVPICARMGIYSFKSKLEDLAFKYCNPVEYADILEQLVSLRKSCNVSITYIKDQLDRFLRERGVEADIFGRIKNIYSIYRKLKEKGSFSVADLYDIFAIRIILPVKTDRKGNESTDHLYSVLGLVHSEWKPISKKFRDYLAVPKPNGYRSLHTVVLGLAPEGSQQPIEIQIRDAEMHREAEYGIASHWVYKESGRGVKQDLQAQIDLLSGLEAIRNELDLDYDIIKEWK